MTLTAGVGTKSGTCLKPAPCLSTLGSMYVNGPRVSNNFSHTVVLVRFSTWTKQWHFAMQILSASSFTTTALMVEIGTTTTIGLVYIGGPHVGNSAIIERCTKKFLAWVKPQSSAMQILCALSSMSLIVTIMAGIIAPVPYKQSRIWIWRPLLVRMLASPSWRALYQGKLFCTTSSVILHR